MDAMTRNGMTGATSSNGKELSELSGIPESRIKSVLAMGERGGLFERRVKPGDSATQKSELVWSLSPIVLDLNRKFGELAETSSRLSREIARAASLGLLPDMEKTVAFNLQIARTVFSKWSIDILALIYSKKTVGFQEMRRGLSRISSRVLSLKLGQMERLGLIKREILNTKPPRVQYSLTEKGLKVAKLGEPVLLYLRFMEGLLVK